MNIRTVVLSAAVAAGIGQAEAATYAEYTFTVRYDGTSYTGLLINDVDTFETVSLDQIEAQGDAFEVTGNLFGTVAVGSVFQFAIQVIHPDIPIPEPWYGNGGRTPICSLGAWDCTSTNDTTLTGNGFRVAKDDDWSMIVSSVAGSTFTVFHWPKGIGVRYTDDGKYAYSYRYENSHFTVLDVRTGIAPVPLPATAALLPLGIGALAALRRRRPPA